MIGVLNITDQTTGTEVIISVWHIETYQIVEEWPVVTMSSGRQIILGVEDAAIVKQAFLKRSMK